MDNFQEHINYIISCKQSPGATNKAIQKLRKGLINRFFYVFMIPLFFIITFCGLSLNKKTDKFCFSVMIIENYVSNNVIYLILRIICFLWNINIYIEIPLIFTFLINHLIFIKLPLLVVQENLKKVNEIGEVTFNEGSIAEQTQGLLVKRNLLNCIECHLKAKR